MRILGSAFSSLKPMNVCACLFGRLCVTGLQMENKQRLSVGVHVVTPSAHVSGLV